LGMYMGYVKYLKIILKEILSKKCKDDQVILNKLCKKYDFIEIDVKNEIFLNTHDKKSNQKAIFLSTPATLTFKRLSRVPFEYGQFVWPYILLLYVILVYLFYKRNKIKHVVLLTILFGFYYRKMEKSCL